MPREWYDLALIALIVVFMYLKAFLIHGNTRLGLAMKWTNIVLGSAYLYTLLYWFHPQLEHPYIRTFNRFAIAVVVVWCVAELCMAKWVFLRFPRRY